MRVEEEQEVQYSKRELRGGANRRKLKK